MPLPNHKKEEMKRVTDNMECNFMLQEHEMLNYILEMSPIAYGNAVALEAMLEAIDNKTMSILDGYFIVYKKLNKVMKEKKNSGGSNKKIIEYKEPLFELVKNETGFINIKDRKLARYKDPTQPYYFKRVQ